VIRLALRVRRADAEAVLAELLELVPGGVEEREIGETIEYAIYGASGELPELPELEAAAGGALVDITTGHVSDGWAEEWKQFHAPALVGDRLWIRPPWEPLREDPGLLDVVIDPGQAFGTGAHHTTRLCLELMLGLRAQGPFADLGCGSGVLAIAAAKLGFDPVMAVDHDPASVEATRANATANGVNVDVLQADLRDEPRVAPTSAANLRRPLLLEVAPALGEPPPRRLIASGLLRGEAGEVSGAFAKHGLLEKERHSAGEWTALLLAG